MKQTAVEWLEQQLFNKRGKFNKSDIEQAKEMEKEERMYSEEEIVALLEYVRGNFYDTGLKWHSQPDTDYTSKEVLEQFKKKY
jgi:hypothetical protein